jgi:uncharacterized protein (DUF2252 family)
MSPEQVVDLVSREDTDRIADLVALRYSRMLTSAFAFFRGAAAVQAADLATTRSTGLAAQLCGDAHLANFGTYATPERRLVFDVNDFDETLPGPFEWDVKRLAVSLVLAGRSNGHSSRACAKTVTAAVEAYRTAMRRFAKQGHLAVWYASLDVEEALRTLAPKVSGKQRASARAALERARTRDSVQAARALTHSGPDGHPRFSADPPLLVPLEDLLPAADATAVRRGLEDLLVSYRNTLSFDRQHLLNGYQLLDIARKVVGVGSVGTRTWVLLLTGLDDRDPLVLQAKEAGASVLEEYCGASSFPNAGQRVVEGQRLIQASSDLFLGWQRTTGVDGTTRDYYVRQLRDGKATADLDNMSIRRLRIYADMCAWTLARAHARSGDRVAIAAYLGKKDTFDHAVAEYADAYADRVDAQHNVLCDAARQGTLTRSAGDASQVGGENGDDDQLRRRPEGAGATTAPHRGA